MDAASKRREISLKVRQDLLQRSRQGIWAHPACVVAALCTTHLLHRLSPGDLAVFAGITLLVLCRALLLRHLRDLDRPGVELLERLHLAAIFGVFFLWGLGPGLAMAHFGLEDKDVLILLLYHWAVACGAINLLVHSRRLMVAAIPVLFAAPLLGLALHGGPQVLPYAGAVFLCVVYALAQGKKLHLLYTQQLSDRYDLSVVAYQDSLTGLPNRLYMLQHLERSVAEAVAHGHHLALLYIDLDGFKHINDQHSHRIGDQFLREVSGRMRRCLRQDDLLARIGGDEFTVLLPNCPSEQDAIQLAHRILLAGREPLAIEGKQLRYSASIGICLFPHPADTLDFLIHSADEAMYAAKAAGKDRVCLALAGPRHQILLPDAPPLPWELLEARPPLQPHPVH